VPHGKLAALSSVIPDRDVGTEDVRILRRQMKAHAEVLNQVVARGVTVLPFAFGIIVPDEQAVIRRVLAPQQARLVEALERLHDHVELTVRAQYRENRVLAEVVAEQPALASSSASRAGGGAQAHLPVQNRSRPAHRRGDPGEAPARRQAPAGRDVTARA
jgi:hypothetical protein